LVAREGIEPPTRGFSVHVPKPAKFLNSHEKLSSQCPIFLRDSGT
jgi:hypothetical protein